LIEEIIMPLVIDDVFIVLHGLLFMSYNSATGFLEVRVPNLSDHHFVGGTRGNRAELPLPVNLTNLGLKGGAPTFPGGDTTQIPTDIKGAIFQFTRDETGVGDFSTDPSKFKGMLTLPWPIEFHPIRCDDIAKTFPYNKKSVVGSRIELNARNRNSPNLCVGICLRYKLDSIGPIPWASHLTLHFYFQPCTLHTIDDVNNDLSIAAHCFTNYQKFDLTLVAPSTPIPRTPTGKDNCHNTPFGLVFEDENSLDEEAKMQDIVKICPPSPFLASRSSGGKDSAGDGDPAASPANCPIFYVG
jgi:hypothetical protein